MNTMIEGSTPPFIASPHDCARCEGAFSRALAPRFVAHPLNFQPNAKPLLDEEGAVCLWRFRPEWKRLAKADGLASLSRSEAARVARFAKSPASKRFAVQRAVLRTILNDVTGVDAGDIDLVEVVDGGLTMASHEGKLFISIAHAGLWIIIGLSRTPLGLGAAIETFLNIDTEENPHAWPALRAQVRHASLASAGVRTADDVRDDRLFDTANASFSFVDDERVWRLADMPMMESTLLTLAARSPLGCVHGFGWTSNVSPRRRVSRVD